jgi:transcriptional activator of cad operon
MPLLANSIFRVGDVRVDPALDEIRKDGVTVKLEPRTMRLLVGLAERAGQVVAVEELLDLVWKDVVVSPDSVYRAVASLRRVLGDDAKDPKYIANVMRRGYRLVASVSTGVSTLAPQPVMVAPVSEADSIPQSEASSDLHPQQPNSVASEPTAARRPLGRLVPAILAASTLAVALGYFAAEQFGLSDFTHATVRPESPPATVSDASVAVMPFLDLSETKDQGYFADGISEELIDRLTKIPGLHVPARTSTFYFKGKQATVAQIAKALGVAQILEGSVRKSGDALRITTQLVRVEDGYELWSETFERPLTDIIKIQDQIATAVVQVFKNSVLDHYPPGLVPTANIDAYILYLRAMSHLTKSGVADYRAADQELNSALALDPRFAAAWARLAASKVYKFDIRGPPSPAECASGRAAADHALELDSSLATAHGAKALVLMYCGPARQLADEEFTTALQIEPGSAETLRAYARFTMSTARSEQALQLAQRAVSADPLNPWSFAALGDVLFHNHRLKEAEAAYRKAISIDTTITGLHGMLAIILLTDHQPAAAVAEAEAETDVEWREETLPFVLDAAGRKADADRAIATFETRHMDESAGVIAEFYACRADVERSVKWFSAWAARHTGDFDDLPYRKVCFANVEADPRFKALRRRINMAGL